MQKEVQQLRELMEFSQYTVAITGTGISFPTGDINPDEGKTEELRVLASEEQLREKPEHYYETMDQTFLQPMAEEGPGAVHKALAKLEKDGVIQGIVTTNVDCLHTMAGSENVAEVQGSLQVNKCSGCGEHDDDYHIWNDGRVPTCEHCGEPMWAFPFYDAEGVHPDNLKSTRSMLAKADLVLMIGYQGAKGKNYLQYIQPWAQVVQINPEHTMFDATVLLDIKQEAGEVLSALAGY